MLGDLIVLGAERGEHRRTLLALFGVVVQIGRALLVEEGIGCLGGLLRVVPTKINCS